MYKKVELSIFDSQYDSLYLLGNLVECLGLISKYIGPVPLPSPTLWGSHVPHVAAHVALGSPEAATPAYILCLLCYI